jgi:hypothetical protein
VLTTKSEKVFRETVTQAFTTKAETVPEPEKISADSIESTSQQPIPPQAPTSTPTYSRSAVQEPVTIFSSISTKIPTIIATSNNTASHFSLTTNATTSINSTTTISNSTTTSINSSTTPTAFATNSTPTSTTTTLNFTTQTNTTPTTGASSPTSDPGVLSNELNYNKILFI